MAKCSSAETQVEARRDGGQAEGDRQARNGEDEPIFVRGDKGVSYGIVMRVMGRINAGGFKKVSLVTEVEEGG